MTQKPDQATATNKGGDFKPHAEGQHPFVCVDVVNLGAKVEQFADNPPREVDKAALIFASGERQDDGSLVIVSVEMTLSMNENANMRKFLESWRGRSYKPEQAEAGVPLHKLQGKVGLATIEHLTTKRGRTFAKMISISPLPKQIDGPNSSTLEDYERPQFFADRKKEYAEAVTKLRAESIGSDDEPPPGEPPEDDNDDSGLPF